MNHPYLDQKKLLEEILLKGKESATQLQTLIQKPLENDGSAEELAIEILRSFTDTLSVLGPNQIAAAAADGLAQSYSSDLSSKITDVGRLKKKPAAVKADRRGSYKRRNVSGTQTKVSSTKEDEYAWRKYGQKEILRSKFPRCYFRCTHKIDQGCKATKQVQIIKQNPLLYQTTYFGTHTCNDKLTLISAPQIIQEPYTSSHPMMDSSCLISFETKFPIKQDAHSDDVCDNKSLFLVPTSETGGSGHLEEVVSSGGYSDTTTNLQGSNFNDMEEAFSKCADLDEYTATNSYFNQESDFFHAD